MKVRRELESPPFVLFSEELPVEDGSMRYATWVMDNELNFMSQQKLWLTLEKKDAYVESMRPEFPQPPLEEQEP